MLKALRLPMTAFLVVFVCATLVAAQGQGPATLTNADIIKMVKAQLSPAVITATIDSSNLNFDLSPDGLIALKQAAVPDALIQMMQTRMRTRNAGGGTDGVSRSAPEKSELLATSKDPDFILRNFKTVMVVASRAKYFGSDDMKAALGRNKDFRELKIPVSMVDDASVADTVLDVDYTFAWDFPFTLKHQNTSLVLISGKGSGPFSGPAGAASVARELAKRLKPYRTPAPEPKPAKK